MKHLVIKVESAFPIVKLLLFSSHILYFGSQLTFKGRIMKLYPLRERVLTKVIIFLYGHMDIYFILWVILQCHHYLFKVIFNFLNFIFFFFLLLRRVWCSVHYSSFWLHPLRVFALSFFKLLDSLLLLQRARKVIFIVKF